MPDATVGVMNVIEWPFRGPEAVADGTLTLRELRRFYKALYPAVWVPRDATLSAQDLACGALIERTRATLLSRGCLPF